LLSTKFKQVINRGVLEDSRDTDFTKGIPSSEGMPMAGRTVSWLFTGIDQMINIAP